MSSQAYNHNFEWQILAPPKMGGSGAPHGKLGLAIDKTFGSLQGLKETFLAEVSERIWKIVIRSLRVKVSSFAFHSHSKIIFQITRSYKPFPQTTYHFPSKHSRPVFASGYMSLVKQACDGELVVVANGDSDNPLRLGRGVPLVSLDLWEHAYLLDVGIYRD